MIDINEIVEAAGDSPVQVQIIERRARKWWDCESCKKEIEPGTRYYNRVIRIYGQGNHAPYFSEHFCVDCEPEPISKEILEKQRSASVLLV